MFYLKSNQVVFQLETINSNIDVQSIINTSLRIFINKNIPKISAIVKKWTCICNRLYAFPIL